MQQAAATELHPGTAADIRITPQNTITSPKNGISHGTNDNGSPLQITVTNNIGGSVNSYVTALDSNNAPVMLQPDGTWFYPTNPGSGTTPQQIDGSSIKIPLNPQGQTTTYSIPGYCSSARVWFAVGELEFFTVGNADGTFSIVQPSQVNPADPSAGINWGFIEFTYTGNGGLWANISYVDFVGLPIGMTLTDTSGGIQQALGLSADAVNSVCNDLKTQAASDGLPWDQLCQSINGTIMRVLSPNDYVSNNSSSGFENYFTDYIKEVYGNFTSSNPLTIDTQGSAGKVSCTSDGTTLTCNGDETPYAQPSAGDIFGCNTGPFANTGSDTHKADLARLCAAFNRGTFLLPGGNVQPGVGADSYYTTAPCNYYSSIVHKYEVDGKGYAFSYDDVNPSDENASGVVSSANPQNLGVTIGGPTNNGTSTRRIRRYRQF
ncbi:putative glucan endo-1,3-beta-glucosidase precursor [Talaromyces proteolyticus]|uniref:Glucan endo-1,3-beta-glucosidase n=1 Tax=Talaromyces proteolyticus TaxID=1131652 RepID=A0AAD4KHQ5_9EURO|nr:putative glucan endo-1,3-beta-glucosidase precursor [Talaromyces proteolyticus]KAH8688732.1 putative glucan endo-1,3-beta-glucosidase precursor [Talaromyces proteolyticus]